MLDLYLKQPGLSFSAFGLFIKCQERIQNFRETGNLKHLYKKELYKVCFVHDAVHSELFQIRL